MFFDHIKALKELCKKWQKVLILYSMAEGEKRTPL